MLKICTYIFSGSIPIKKWKTLSRFYNIQRCFPGPIADKDEVVTVTLSEDIKVKNLIIDEYESRINFIKMVHYLNQDWWYHKLKQRRSLMVTYSSAPLWNVLRIVF